MRPTHIRYLSCLKANNCLCQIHQNSAFLLRALKAAVPHQLSPSPDIFIKRYDNRQSREQLLEQWHRVLDDKDGKHRVKIISTTKTRADFKTKFLADFDMFTSHGSNALKLYQELKRLKENLPENHMLMQMDSAENYTCAFTDYVHSAYGNQAFVTLHPCVIYYKDGEKLKHASCVYVSHL